MTRKYFDGVVRDAGVSEPVDEELKAVVTGAREKVEACMEDFRIADALNELFLIFRRANKYIDETMPWALGKDETKKDRLATVLYNLTESISDGREPARCLLARDGGKDRRLPQRALKDAGRVRLLRGVPERKSYRRGGRAPVCAL